jgi:hypothetical protein
MALGAFAPLPLRLGGTSEEGWLAAQHARLSADLAAIRRTLPFAVVTVEVTGATAGTVTDYAGRNGVGIAAGPTVSVSGHTATITWPASFMDDYQRRHVLRISSASASAHGNAGQRVDHEITSPRSVEVTVLSSTSVPSTGSLTLEVWSHESASFADYGGDPNKEDSDTEGDQPYAWGWYREILAMQGSAYTTDRDTLVHAENLATARQHAALYSRLPEKRVANSLPGRSDEKLPYWVDVLRVRVRDGEPGHEVRRRAAIKYRSARTPTVQNVEESVSALLGDTFVALHRIEGTSLDDPPGNTFWSGVNPGDPGIDLGGGAWMSERCHYAIEVQKPSDVELARFHDLVNVQLTDMLDGMLPAWATWAWATSDGFLLDISQLDFDGLGS